MVAASVGSVPKEAASAVVDSVVVQEVAAVVQVEVEVAQVVVEAVAAPVEPVPVDEGDREQDNAAHLTAPEGAIFLTTGAWMPLPV